jgi:hypothetical protein
MKIKSIIPVFLVLSTVLSCGQKSFIKGIQTHTDSLPVARIDTSQQVFDRFDPNSITQITIMNCQFDTDTSLTNMNCRRNLTPKQIIQFCNILNDQPKVDTVIIGRNSQETDFIISIASKNKNLSSSLLSFYRRGMIASWNIQLEKSGYKQLPDLKIIQKFWDKARRPPIFCDVIFDPHKIPMIDSLNKKYKTVFDYGIILKDSADLFMLNIGSSCIGREKVLDSIYIRKNDGIITRATIHEPPDAFQLYEKPFNSAKIIHTISRPSNYMDGIEAVVINCFQGWMKVKMVINKKIYIGWIKDYCSNPCTTCT